MKPFVITVARGYGSGGKTIGKMLAEDLGVKYYDMELLRLASDESGINEHLFAEVDEKLKTPRLFKPRKSAYTGEVIPPDSEDFVSDQNLFNYQAKVIRDLAEKESCVIIGRSADYILKEHKPILRVFIYSPDEVRIKNVMESHKVSEKEAKQIILETDKRYHKRHMALTGSNRGDRHNRDILIDSSLLGVDGTARLIETLAKQVEKQ